MEGNPTAPLSELENNPFSERGFCSPLQGGGIPHLGAPWLTEAVVVTAASAKTPSWLVREDC